MSRDQRNNLDILTGLKPMPKYMKKRIFLLNDLNKSG